MQMDTAARYHRQLDLIDQDRLAELPITVIGAGAIGSFTALVLAKMGAHNLTVFDHDTVEVHNLPNQFFQLDHIGANKASATARLIKAFEGIDIEAHPDAYTDQPAEGVVVVAVDSIEARRTIWRQMRFRPEVDLLIDGRMGAEVVHLFCVDPKAPNDVRRYGDTLHDPEEVIQERCTAKSTLYCAGAVASHIAGTVARFVNQEPYQKEVIVDLKQQMLIAPER
jgi:molybdopterin/thiamine biosynthesis adenylyltransferase